MKAQKLGCLMIGISGAKLTAAEQQQLLSPKVGGVILFSRNYQNPAQLTELCAEIHALRSQRLLIAVDHEGGRVQRFREGFTQIPAMQTLGASYLIAPEPALKQARVLGWLMATELLACGVDFSFAPVLDIDYGRSEVIGDRAFSNQPEIITDLAQQFTFGMREAGMSSVGKHFPGHGFVAADTHHEIAVDERSWQQIESQDVQPFLQLIKRGMEGIMPAHVRYPQVDDLPVGFSKHWLQTVLRGLYQYNGAIISDDLGMKAAAVYGNMTELAKKSLDAGCDLILVCNELDQIDQLLADLDFQPVASAQPRLRRLACRNYLIDKDFKSSAKYQEAIATLEQLTQLTA